MLIYANLRSPGRDPGVQSAFLFFFFFFLLLLIFFFFFHVPSGASNLYFSHSNFFIFSPFPGHQMFIFWPVENCTTWNLRYLMLRDAGWALRHWRSCSFLFSLPSLGGGVGRLLHKIDINQSCGIHYIHVVGCPTERAQRIHCFAGNSSFCQAHAFEVLKPTSTYRKFIICRFYLSKFCTKQDFVFKYCIRHYFRVQLFSRFWPGAVIREWLISRFSWCCHYYK